MPRPLLALFCLCTLVHAQPTPLPDQVYSFDPKVVHAPVPIETVAAEMPDEARRQQLGGFCALKIVVDKKGFPQDLRIVRCTDSIFAENSLKAVKQYRFKPATTVQDNKPVLFRMTIEISYRFGASRGPAPPPRPRIGLSFLIPSQPAQSEPDAAGIYPLSHAFESPNSLPRLRRFANAGFGRAAFLLGDGAGCVVALTIDETGQPKDVQVTKCDNPSLEDPVVRSLQNSYFSPAVLEGKAVPVRASVHIVCEGFEPPPRP